MLGKNNALVHRPQINLARPTAGRMWLVGICAGMAVVQSALTDSGTSLIIAAVSVTAALGVELVINLRAGTRTIRDGSTVASALVYALLLPNRIHPVLAVLGIIFAMLVVKYSFGGLGSNWLNPAIGGWLFVRFSWPVLFAESLAHSPLSVLGDALGRGFSDPQGSPLAILKVAGITGTSLDASVTSLLNSTVFSITGAKLPDGYVDLFALPGPGIIADRGLAALLLGTILVTASQVNRFWIPAVFLGVYGLLIRIFGAIPYGGVLWNGDVLFGLFSGGTIAAAFLLLADPTTGPKSDGGAAIASVLAGVFAFVFRYQGFESYGAFFAVAFLNALVPLIRGIEGRYLYETRRVRV